VLHHFVRLTWKDSGCTDGCVDWCAVDMGTGVGGCGGVRVPGLEFLEKLRMV